MKNKKLFWITLHSLNWALILGYWLFTNYPAFLSGPAGGFANILLALGKLSGFIAAYMVLVQFFLMGRNIWLERAFGLDKLSKTHAKSGKLAFYFIVAHPLLLVTGNALNLNMSVWGTFKLFISGDDVRDAFFAVVLFVIVVACSIYVSRKRLKYETWYYLHLLVYIAFFLSYEHQFSVGEDVLSHNWFYGYWLALYVLMGTSHVLFRILRPLFNLYRFGWTVERTVAEPSNVTSVYIRGKGMDRFKGKAGQFVIVRFLAKGFAWQAHPFSLSNIPNADGIRLSIKALGDFTNNVKNLAPGTKVIVDGPFGVFTDAVRNKDKVLMIAGGIGITPLRSLMEEMLSLGKDVAFLNAIQTRNDIVFKDELEGLVARYGLTMTHVMSKETPDFAGEKGFVDEEKLKRLVPDFVERDIFLCGPPPMMNALIALFKRLGVPDAQVHFEKFEL